MVAKILFTAVVIVMGFIGNLLVILVAVRNRIFHNMRGFLLASLALSDLLFVILLLIPRALSIAYKEWFFGERLCHGFAYLLRVFYLSTIFHLCAVSHDRYQAIVKDHLTYDGLLTRKKIMISTLVLWILPILILRRSPFQLGNSVYNPVLYACEQNWNSTVTFPFFIIIFLVPFLFIFYTNYKVIMVARRLERQVNFQLGSKTKMGDGRMVQLDQLSGHQQRNKRKTKPGGQKKNSLETNRDIDQENSRQETSELERNTIRKAWQMNVKDEWSVLDSGCSQRNKNNLAPYCPGGLNTKGDGGSLNKPNTNKELTQGRFPSALSLSVEKHENPTIPAMLQKENPKSNSHGGLLTILKECRAARDVLLILAAFLVCFLPFWIHGVYRAITGEHHSSEVIQYVRSQYVMSCLCNPIIYSIRKREFRQAVRKILPNCLTKYR